jgi:hypothetical protein
MNEYLSKISAGDSFESMYLENISKQPDLFDQSNNGFYQSLTRKGSHLLSIALNTPEIEHKMSVSLANRLNINSSREDLAVDFNYNMTRTGGSGLHHNLDGSHTFAGAMQAIRTHCPDTAESEVWIRALEHLGRDFTTPSGINPFLDPTDFRTVKAYLGDLGLGSQLSNDFLNLNAAELGLSMIAGASVIFGIPRHNTQLIARQVGRLATTFFFSGNLLGILVATGLFIRMIVGEHEYDQYAITDMAKGAGQILLVSALLPSLPLSVSIILGSSICAAVHYTFTGQFQIALEMERVFRTQFPSYRSYLGSI